MHAEIIEEKIGIRLGQRIVEAKVLLVADSIG